VNYEAVALYSQVGGSAFFLAAMIFIWVRFIQPAVIASQEANNRLIAEAERHRDEAKAMLDGLQGEIEKAQADAAAIKTRAGVQAEREIEAMLAEANAAGERAVRNASGELARSRVAAQARLREEFLERSLDLARGEASKRVSAPVNAKLVAEFAEVLDSGGRT